MKKLLILTVLLAGCTTIERVNVNTVAVNCDIERGQGQQAQGQAAANLLQQAGSATAAFVGSLRSTITCPNGTVVEAEVEGGDVNAAP